MNDPANENATAILLTCMDFRYPQRIIEYMNDEGLEGEYYHVILAGASLGAVLDIPPHLKPQWRSTFFDHLEIVLTPPGAIEKVYILDHRDCKAYRIFGRLPDNPDPERERIAHENEMNKLKAIIQERYEGLPVKLGLLERLEGEEEFTVLDMD